MMFIPATRRSSPGHDLDVVLPPAWVQLVNATAGSVAPQAVDTLKVRFHAMMGDTTTAALIKIGSNDLTQPLVEIPVTIAMLAPVTAIGGQETAVPGQFSLEQNYPNPFNPLTTIRFSLAAHTRVRLTLYDVLGREVAVLVDEFKPAGIHLYKLDASALASGVYFYVLETGEYISDSKKMVIMR